MEDDILDATDGGRNVSPLRLIADGTAPVREGIIEDLCGRG